MEYGAMKSQMPFLDARILVVDDEPANVEILRRALRREGYRDINGITDPTAVPEALRQFRPDLLLLDLLMPHLDGFQILELMKETLPTSSYLPVLVLTADATAESKRKALAGGAKDFIPKRFDLTEVLLRIRNMLELRQLHLQLQTENRDLEERVRERTIELERALGTEREAARRLRALDEMKNAFLTAVSHELRTPLTSILGGALTLEQLGLAVTPEEQQELLHRIAANARKLNRLLADLLDVDRLSRGVMEPIRFPTDVRALIETAVTESDVSAHHPTEIQADDLTVELDAAKVERIVENLLINAARHTPPGTAVWVKAWGEDEGVVIAVDDAGPGLPEELRNSVFEPFQHGAHRVEHAPGVGIGLALVSQFAHLHGGRAWVEDRPGGGASFRVFLPGRRLVRG